MIGQRARMAAEYARKVSRSCVGVPSGLAAVDVAEGGAGVEGAVVLVADLVGEKAEDEAAASG